MFSRQALIYTLGYWIERIGTAVRSKRIAMVGYALECRACEEAKKRGRWTPSIFTADIRDKALLRAIDRRENWKYKHPNPRRWRFQLEPGSVAVLTPLIWFAAARRGYDPVNHAIWSGIEIGIPNWAKLTPRWRWRWCARERCLTCPGPANR